jgi:hypothetical protein
MKILISILSVVPVVGICKVGVIVLTVHTVYAFLYDQSTLPNIILDYFVNTPSANVLPVQNQAQAEITFLQKIGLYLTVIKTTIIQNVTAWFFKFTNYFKSNSNSNSNGTTSGCTTLKDKKKTILVNLLKENQELIKKVRDNKVIQDEPPRPVIIQDESPSLEVPPQIQEVVQPPVVPQNARLSSELDNAFLLNSELKLQLKWNDADQTYVFHGLDGFIKNKLENSECKDSHADCKKLRKALWMHQRLNELPGITEYELQKKTEAIQQTQIYKEFQERKQIKDE